MFDYPLPVAGRSLFDLLRDRCLSVPIVLFVALAFFMLYGSPTAAAVNQFNDEQDRHQFLEASLVPASASGKLGRFLDELKQQLVPGAGLRMNQLPMTPDWDALDREVLELDTLWRAEWQSTLDRFRQANVPEQIVDRHHEVRTAYETRFDEFRSHVLRHDQAGLTTMLADMQTRPTHKQNNFEQPSFAVMQPDPENVPRNIEALSHMALEEPGPVTLSTSRIPALGLSDLHDADDPAYLAETPEVVITDIVAAMAADLEHDPIQIYHFVRNEIDFLPGWGATQDAELTLGSRRGNAMDTSTLLIALLRASGIPARYAYGVIEVEAQKFTNWMGNFSHVNAAMQHASSGGIPVGMSSSNNATVSNVILEHVWVEAAIDYLPSGGRHMVEADTWVALDASFKQYVYLQGLDAIEIAELDVEQLVDDFAASGTIDEELGYVQNLDIGLIEAAQEQVRDAMIDFIEEQMDDPTTGDVLGGRKAIVQERGELTERPDNSILVRGSSWASLPDVLRNSLRVTFDVDYLTGQPQGGVVLPWASVNNHRLTLSYRPTSQADEQALLALLPEGEITDLDQLPQTLPGHSISFTPEIKLNGEIILTGPSSVDGFTLETMFAMEVQQLIGNTKWGIPFKTPVPKGSYLAIMANAGSVSRHALEAAQQRAEEAQYILENEVEDQYGQIDRERLMGELFYAGVLAYHAQLEGLGGLMAAQMSAEYRTNLSVGTYGYQPWVRYVFGMPMALDSGGVHMDLDYVPSQLTKHNGSSSQRANAAQPLGMLKSALEHLIPQQNFESEDESGEAVSAVAAIARAQAEGQRMFRITQENLDEAMSEISISAESRQDIQRAVSQFGYEAFVHEAPITVPGWRGSGYILTNPDTGAGTYMIDGGKNGAFKLIISGLLILMVAFLAFPVLIATGVGLVFFALAIIVATSLIAAGIALIEGNVALCNALVSLALGTIAVMIALLFPGVSKVVAAMIGMVTNTLASFASTYSGYCQ